MTQRPVLIAVDSDLHMGSTQGLFPPEGVRGPDGNRILPNKAQEWSFLQWEKRWKAVAELQRHYRATLVQVLDGDLFEGNKFAAAAQIISQNHEPQAYIASRIIGDKSLPWVLRPVERFITRGTEVHVGPVGESEEAFARSVKATRPSDESWSWWFLQAEWYGVLCDFRHHPQNNATKPWTMGAAVQREAAQVFYEHVERGRRHPDIAVRGHVHWYGDSYDTKPTRAVYLPPWQLATMHAHKVVSNKVTVPEVGGISIVIFPTGKYEIHANRYTPDPEAPWRPSQPSAKS